MLMLFVAMQQFYARPSLDPSCQSSWHFSNISMFIIPSSTLLPQAGVTIEVSVPERWMGNNRLKLNFNKIE